MQQNNSRSNNRRTEEGEEGQLKVCRKRLLSPTKKALPQNGCRFKQRLWLTLSGESWESIKKLGVYYTKPPATQVVLVRRAALLRFPPIKTNQKASEVLLPQSVPRATTSLITDSVQKAQGWHYSPAKLLLWLSSPTQGFLDSHQQYNTHELKSPIGSGGI